MWQEGSKNLESCSGKKDLGIFVDHKFIQSVTQVQLISSELG